MAFKLAEAYVQLSSKGFSGVSGTIDAVAGRFSKLGVAAGAVSGLLPGIGTLLAGLGVGAGIGGLIKMAADAESTAISFEVLLGSATAAERMIRELNDFARQTPFDFPGVSSAAKTMLSFGVASEDVMNDLRVISDIAQGDAQKLGSLALVFGQIASAGRLTGQDLLQLVNAGFNPLQTISEKTGQSVSSLRDKMSDGLISFDMVREAFRSATSEGGRFYQMNEKQSKTLKGLWANLGEGIGLQLRNIGQGIIDAFQLKNVLSSTVEATDRFGEAFSSVMETLVPSVSRFVTSVSDAFSGLWDSVSGGASIVDVMIDALKTAGEWSQWLYDTASFVVDNWSLLWGILIEETVLFFSNLQERIRTWGVNAVEIAQWFGRNWYDIVMTTIDAILTMFINLGTNIRTLWKEVVDFIWSMGDDPIEFNFTPMLDGFRSTISEMPELTEAAVQESTGYLDAMRSQLAENAQIHFDRPETKSFAKSAEEARKNAPANGGSSGSGKAGKFVGISELSKGIQTSALKKSDQFAQQTAQATQKLAGAVGADGKLKTSSGPATAG